MAGGHLCSRAGTGLPQMPHRVANPGFEDQLGVCTQPRPARACAPGEWSYGNESPVPARNTFFFRLCVVALLVFLLARLQLSFGTVGIGRLWISVMTTTYNTDCLLSLILILPLLRFLFPSF